MNNKGKALEEKFRNWCGELGVYCQRFYDARSMGHANAGGRPADFWVYSGSHLSLVEVKDYKNSNVLPFKAFRPSQFKGFKDSQHHGFDYYVFVRLKGGLYIISMRFVVDFIEVNIKNRSSVPENFFKEHGLTINSRDDLRGML